MLCCMALQAITLCLALPWRGVFPSRVCIPCPLCRGEQALEQLAPAAAAWLCSRGQEELGVHALVRPQVQAAAPGGTAHPIRPMHSSYHEPQTLPASPLIPDKRMQLAAQQAVEALPTLPGRSFLCWALEPPCAAPQEAWEQ